MDLNEEIRTRFASLSPRGAVPIPGLDKEYRAWVVRLDSEYGVAVPVNEEIEIAERFSSVRIWTSKMEIDHTPYHLLLLTCQEEHLRLEFSTLCAQFIDPGENGEERQKLIADPLDWWKRWRDLLGNSIRVKSPHSVLGELITLRKLLDIGEKPEWRGGTGGVNDVTSGKAEYEVKSTTMRYESIVSINGQFQLHQTDTDTLYLVFCRFEESSNGESIDDLIHQLTARGYNRVLLDNTLTRLGYESGSSDRKRKYKLLEMRRYLVDDNFPRITPDSFIGKKIHPSIKQISYRIDLAGLDFEKWL